MLGCAELEDPGASSGLASSCFAELPKCAPSLPSDLCLWTILQVARCEVFFSFLIPKVLRKRPVKAQLEGLTQKPESPCQPAGRWPSDLIRDPSSWREKPAGSYPAL